MAALVERERPEVAADAVDRGVVADRLCQLERLEEPRPRRRAVALLAGEDARRDQRLQARVGPPRPPSSADGEQPPPRAQESPREPVAPQRAAQQLRGVGVFGRERVADGGVEVLALVVEPLQPRPRVLARDPGLRLRRQAEVRERVAAADLDRVGALGQPLERVLAQRLEHREALAAADHEALVGQSSDAVERRGAAHRLRGLHRAAAGEHAELREQRALARRRAGRGSSRPWRAACAGARARRAAAPPSRSSRARAARASPPGRARFARAAASSIASGSPSRRRQIASTSRPRSVGADRSRARRPGALDMNSAPPASGERRPVLVLAGEPQRRAARDEQRESARARAAGESGAALETCSKLSTTSRHRWRERAGPRASRRPARVRDRRGRDPLGPTVPPARRTRAAVGERAVEPCASSSASRVLPMPPGPVSVSRRTAGLARRRSRRPRARVAAEQRRRRYRQGGDGGLPGAASDGPRAEVAAPDRGGGSPPRARGAPCRARGRGLDQRGRTRRYASSASAWRPRGSSATSVARVAQGCSARERLELGDDRRVLPAARSASMRSSSAASRRSAGAPASSSRPEQRRVGEGRPAEQGERLAQQLRRRPAAPRLARAARRARSKRSRSSSPARRDGVARGPCEDRLSGPSRAPQLRDVDLQRLGRRRGRLARPTRRRSGAPGRHGLVARGAAAASRAAPAAWAPQLDRALRTDDPERSEDREVHRLTGA